MAELFKNESDGGLLLANAERRVTAPVEVDLRSDGAGGDFWSGSP